MLVPIQFFTIWNPNPLKISLIIHLLKTFNYVELFFYLLRSVWEFRTSFKAGHISYWNNKLVEVLITLKKKLKKCTASLRKAWLYSQGQIYFFFFLKNYLDIFFNNLNNSQEINIIWYWFFPWIDVVVFPVGLFLQCQYD